eukprot:gnl/MRDRNA2_/MRDRNA2_154547_c0_seq1.p1 gnl/MRDRNA2_/MRDRNA2_154547_c0~~gnl/MRDRNA2_/MRDRNA2_154547_c0_seq1.p1  ORF type:complete len:196 (-),score=31.72 gnl/MRDRNA2_/MRDRNA2_154547_c0_seq1:52-639(-)
MVMCKITAIILFILVEWNQATGMTARFLGNSVWPQIWPVHDADLDNMTLMTPSLLSRSAGSWQLISGYRAQPVGFWSEASRSWLHVRQSLLKFSVVSYASRRSGGRRRGGRRGEEEEQAGGAETGAQLIVQKANSKELATNHNMDTEASGWLQDAVKNAASTGEMTARISVGALTVAAAGIAITAAILTIVKALA